jgi:ABC-type transport system substrate-binding protein
LRRILIHWVFIILLSNILLSFVSPIVVAQSELPGGPYLGPFVEKIRFVCAGKSQDDYYTAHDEQTIMLMNGDVDIISGTIKSDEYYNLVEADNIEIVTGYRYGYDISYFNCEKWPFNITEFRKAILLAMDKHETVEVWQDGGILHDGCLPRSHPACIENELPHYYDEDISEAAEILDNLGFIDSDEDGEREGPGGIELEEFEIVYLQPTQSGPLFRDLNNVTARALTKLNFSTSLTRHYSFSQNDERYASGDFDIIFSSIVWRTMDLLRWSQFWISDAWSKYGYNPGKWFNTSWDSLAQVIENSLDYDEIINAAKEMQRIWHEECPAIIHGQRLYHTAYRTDDFEGIQHNPLVGAPNFFTALKVHEKDSQSWDNTGGTYSWAIPMDSGFARPQFPELSGPTPHDIGWYSAFPIMQLTQDSLVRIGPQLEDIPWLAQEWLIETHADDPSVPEGNMRITVDVVQNATWSDGTPITADDFIYTINFHRDNDNTHEYLENRDYDLRADIVSYYSTIPTEFIVEFNTESYWNWHSICYLSVLPSHQSDMLDFLQSTNNYDSESFTDLAYAGPFKPTEWIVDEYIELSQNEYYWKNPRHLEPPITSTTTTTTSTTPPPDFTFIMISGIVAASIIIIVGGYFIFKKR